MAKKEFKYKGYTLDELKAMSMDELVKIMPSDVRRSILRGFTESQTKLMGKIRKASKLLDNGEKVKVIRTHCRDMPIIPEMVGLDFMVYNGKEFVKVIITQEMLGHFIGEFTYNRAIVKHSSPGVGATRSSLFVPIR
ncbi:MAG: 30S ribosomal protein S19 [Candidatus Altiarchaeota archaeon]|nr:30S ribosomal protein S19 [Candidatus Altiarchaeota archaeon]